MKGQLITAGGFLAWLVSGTGFAQAPVAPNGSAAPQPVVVPEPGPPATTAAVSSAVPTAPQAPTPLVAATPAAITVPDAVAASSAADTQAAGRPAVNQNEPKQSESTAADLPEPGRTKNKKKVGRAAAEANTSAISLSPTAPQVSTLPGAVTPGFDQQTSISSGDWKFDVHGLFILPLAVGLNERNQAYEGQKKNVLHSPAVTPENREGFNWTGVTPQPWFQMNFSYGNRDVTANVILSAKTVNNGNAYYNPSDYQGITDAFLTYRPPLARSINLVIDVGAFSSRYGHMGEYDTGRYGTPLVARLSGVGANLRSIVATGGLAQLMFEGGIMGQIGKAPLGVEPAGWNGFTDPNIGSTYAAHAHAGVRFAKRAELVGHGIYAFEQDDRANPTTQPDGHLSVLGVDGHWSGGYLGHLYLGLARTDATNARGISPVVRIMEAPGGPGLMRAFFGPNSGGNGSLTSVGVQYDLSLGSLLSHPVLHTVNTPDITLAVFGIYSKVHSHEAAYDQVNKLKYGAEASYSIASWFAASARYDRVMANTDDMRQTFAVISPRVIFRSDWDSQDQVVLQYSRYLVGSGVPTLNGYPPVADYYTAPDKDVVTLTAAIWW